MNARLLAVVAGLACTAGAAPGASPIQYNVLLNQPQTQTLVVQMIIDDPPTPTFDVKLPTWRPGRYLIHEPAGTIRTVKAIAGDRLLQINKTDKATWRIETDGAASVMVEYEIYANALSNRTRHVDDTHAFLSGESVFMYMDERRHDPLTVRLHKPAPWRVSTGLEPAPLLTDTWRAANYDVLVDSPFEIGLHEHVQFEVGGKQHEIAIWGTSHFDREQLVEDFTAIIETQRQIFGALPYKKYVFLIHAVPGARGATEHLNSTIVQTSRRALEQSIGGGDAYLGFLGVVSHEMFHTWNVKQFRPAGIHPYDYQRENYTDLLWVAEGTTVYYDNLAMVRGGVLKVDTYLDRLSKAITRLRRHPGAGVQSLAESSFDAWIKFNRRHADSVNSTVSFYGKGAQVSFLIDLMIRNESRGDASLDDVVRGLFEQFPLDGPGYTTADLIELIEKTGCPDVDAFFDAYVRGTDTLPFIDALGIIGLELRFKPDDQDDDSTSDDDSSSDSGDSSSDDDSSVAPAPYTGLRLADRSGRTMVTAVLTDGPAHEAGINVDDEIIALDDMRLTASELDHVLRRYKAGDSVTLHVMRRGTLRTIELPLAGRLAGNWKVSRVDDPTEAQRRAFKDWSGQSFSDPEDEDQDDADDH